MAFNKFSLLKQSQIEIDCKNVIKQLRNSAEIRGKIVDTTVYKKLGILKYFSERIPTAKRLSSPLSLKMQQECCNNHMCLMSNYC